MVMVSWLWIVVALIVGFIIGWFARRPESPEVVQQPAASDSGASERIRTLEAELADCRSTRTAKVVSEPVAPVAEPVRFSAAAPVTESAPVVEPEPEVSLAPAEPVLDLGEASSVLGRKIKLDDLKVIEGIGPKIEALIIAEGITTWRALSLADVSVLQRILDEAGPRYRMHDPGTWPRQAGLLADGQWSDFSALTDELSGGR
ncbi:MAG: hypothetical protein ACRCSP_10080 [Rhodoglobus sp.]